MHQGHRIQSLHGTTQEMTLKMSHDFVLDGEGVESGTDGITHLFSGPLV
ncbi:hypothetical protein [Entomobacter blattae]|nr:hypothetical protein [Entomobacter blattae]